MYLHLLGTLFDLLNHPNSQSGAGYDGRPTLQLITIQTTCRTDKIPSLVRMVLLFRLILESVISLSATKNKKTPTTAQVDRITTTWVCRPTWLYHQGLGDNWDNPQRYRKNPKSLVELAADVLDRQPLPDCMYWGIEEVINWLQSTVKLPQYKACFKRNFVTGRLLILLGPNHLVKMKIQKLEHLHSPHRAILHSEYWRMTKMMNAKEEPACRWLTIATGQDIHNKVLIARVQSLQTVLLHAYVPREPLHTHNHPSVLSRRRSSHMVKLQNNTHYT
ncbi:ribosomal large subunit assembly [Homalodisca vitripennis]|nr:ribosomal large subunit assembly [Homalodisca vitripennis]